MILSITAIGVYIGKRPGMQIFFPSWYDPEQLRIIFSKMIIVPVLKNTSWLILAHLLLG